MATVDDDDDDDDDDAVSGASYSKGGLFRSGATYSKGGLFSKAVKAQGKKSGE